tara:strand:- start:776 stop:1048 length:273 start_codon:yes stop_codon:yes gene_type:complete
MRPYDLKDYEILTALRFFCYYMPMEQRRQLMAEFPVIYNKLMEKEIVVSVGKGRLESLEKMATTLPDHNGEVPTRCPEVDALVDELLEEA